MKCGGERGGKLAGKLSSGLRPHAETLTRMSPGLKYNLHGVCTTAIFRACNSLQLNPKWPIFLFYYILSMYTNNQGDRGAGTDINLCNGSPTCFCLTVVDQVESGVMIVIYRYAQPGSDGFVKRISR